MLVEVGSDVMFIMQGLLGHVGNSSLFECRICQNSVLCKYF